MKITRRDPIKILVVDDEQERRNAFIKRYPDDIVFTAETSENAIRHLKNEKYFDTIFLDHDLGEIEVEPPDYHNKKSTTFPITSRPFVRYLCRHVDEIKHPAWIIVHSWNGVGAKSIGQTLADYGYHVIVEPFQM